MKHILYVMFHHLSTCHDIDYMENTKYSGEVEAITKKMFFITSDICSNVLAICPELKCL